MSLLNVKSDEIARLETSLALERSNAEALTVKTKRLEDDLASAQALTSQPSADAITLAELQMQRAQEQVSWDADRAAFIASLDVLKSSKALAETDRDFFRDQYSQASGYVSTVRSENAELEQRAQVAEGKARDGVWMIRAMFEGQVKALQGDLAQWKGIALLLQEKDKRTGDEIRRKAAEEPELRAKYEQSRREVEKLEGVVFELLRERNVLKRKLDSVREQVERTINEKRDGTLNGTEVSHSEELVYRCLWRPGGDSKPCLNIFSSPEVCLYTCSRGVNMLSDLFVLGRTWSCICIRMNTSLACMPSN
jgi:chromosome segregation ATPase